MGKDDRKDRKRDRSRSDSRERNSDRRRSSHKDSKRVRSRTPSPSRRRDRRDDERRDGRSSYRRSRSRSNSNDRNRKYQSSRSDTQDSRGRNTHSSRSGESSSSSKARSSEELEREKDAQKAAEQAVLDEEMRKRRDRVKAWQEAKSKRLAEEQGVAPGTSEADSVAPEAQNGADANDQASAEKPHGWSLEDDEEEEVELSGASGGVSAGGGISTKDLVEPPLAPLKHADHVSNLDRDIDDDEEDIDALSKPAAVFKKIIASPSKVRSAEPKAAPAPAVPSVSFVEEVDPLEAFMTGLYDTGDVEKQLDLPSLVAKPKDNNFITFDQIMVNLRHPGVSAARQEDIEDEFTEGIDMSQASSSIGRRVGDPRGWESDVGSESGAASPEKHDDEATDRNTEMNVDGPEETEEEREAREVREKQEFIAAIRKAREEEEEVRDKLARMEEAAVAEAARKAKEKLGRVFAGEGDMVDEAEVAEKKKGALELLEEARKGKMLKEIDHSKVEYMPFRKNLYIVPRAISKLSEAEAGDARDELHIKVRGRGCPTPVSTWEQCGLSDRLLDAIRAYELKEPFPIQKQAIPAIMCGRDVIGVAKTGSGKTLAFLLPMLRHILDQPPLSDNEGPIGLIMAPARELANQIFSEAKKFAKPLGLRVACIYGGAGVAEQIADLKRGSDIVVCTPGRMIDILCMQAGKLVSLKRVTMVVLDEADRMFDMGFEPQIKMIIQNVRPDRQTVLFSATFPKQIEKLAKAVLRLPLEIVVGERSTVNKDITQYIEVHEEDDKFLRLLQLLGLWYEKGSTLVFVDKQEKCDHLFQELLKLGYPCLSLHGGKDQVDRDHTLHEFKTGVKTVMIATSVAGRGLDVPDIVCVVNYNCPNHLEDYVHRVGRTGRAGRKGTAYTFISEKEDQYAHVMIKALEKTKQPIPEELSQLAAQFKAKVDRGEAQWSGSGFVGKGFTFDANELNEAQQMKANQKRAYDLEQGLIGNGDERPEEEDNDDDEVPEGSLVPFAITTGATFGFSAPTSSSAAAPLSGLDKAKAMAAQLANRGAAAAGETKGGVDTQAALLRAKMIASQMASGKIATGLDLEQGAEYFADELDINDYPPQARRKVTSRPIIEEVKERTGAAIITRGTYIPPGKPPGPGEKRLHMLIESSSDSSVRQARMELMRVLEEETIKVSTSGNVMAGAGRYSVL